MTIFKKKDGIDQELSRLGVKIEDGRKGIGRSNGRS